jgi:hypothetical protein
MPPSVIRSKRAAVSRKLRSVSPTKGFTATKFRNGQSGAILWAAFFAERATASRFSDWVEVKGEATAFGAVRVMILKGIVLGNWGRGDDG